MNETLFIITLTEGLMYEEELILRDYERAIGFPKVTYENPCSIILSGVDAETEEKIFPKIASWLAMIGAVESVFSIEKREIHYTDFMSLEVEELLEVI